jgi:hypothetical protein
VKKGLDKIKDIIAANAARQATQKVEKDHECNVSTGIHGGLTFGSGSLDSNGFWRFPCDGCARKHEEKYPEDGKCWPFESSPTDNSQLESANRTLLNRIWKLELMLKTKEEELEVERMRLVACGVVAMANTEASAAKTRLPKSHPYYSASLDDVERAVEREMDLRTKIEKIKEVLCCD